MTAAVQLSLPLIVEPDKPKFVLREDHWTDEQFSAVQAIRGRAGGRARRRVNADRDRQIRRLHRDGLSFAAIGRRFHLHRSTVKRICAGREHLIRREWIVHPDGDRAPSSMANFGPKDGARRLKNWRLGRRFGETRIVLREPGVPSAEPSRNTESSYRESGCTRARVRRVPSNRPWNSRSCFDCFRTVPRSARVCPSCGSTELMGRRLARLHRELATRGKSDA